MPGYLFDTDVLSATIRPLPPTALIRRIAAVPVPEQFTTAITKGELIYGAERRASVRLRDAVQALLASGPTILPFDSAAAARYGMLRAELERAGSRLDEPDLRIASIALARDLTLVSGNVRHFERVPELVLEDWVSG